jgi:hypothetical protein
MEPLLDYAEERLESTDQTIAVSGAACLFAAQEN